MSSLAPKPTGRGFDGSGGVAERFGGLGVVSRAADTPYICQQYRFQLREEEVCAAFEGSLIDGDAVLRLKFLGKLRRMELIAISAGSGHLHWG